MKEYTYNGTVLNSSMSLYEIRRIIFTCLNVSISDKIRVFSILYFESKKIAMELDIPFTGYFGAIGDFRLDSFPDDIKDNLGYIINSENFHLIENEKIRLLQALRNQGVNEYQYDLTGNGYRDLRLLLQKQQNERLGITFYLDEPKDGIENEIFVVSGASLGLKICFEALYRNLGRKPVVLFPAPLFLPVIKASDCLIQPIIHDTNEKNIFKISPLDLDNLIKSGAKLDAFYLCPLNNPTSIAYSGEEILTLFDILISSYPMIVIIIDNVYFASLEKKVATELGRIFGDQKYINHLIFIDSEGKAKACTGKRSGAIYTKNSIYKRSIADILRNSTGGASSGMMIDTMAQIRVVGNNVTEGIYREMARRRDEFLRYIFNDVRISQYVVPLEKQWGLQQGTYWIGGLYAFVKLKDGVDPTNFILETGLIGSPGNIFGSSQYSQYLRFSFGFESSCNLNS